MKWAGKAGRAAKMKDKRDTEKNHTKRQKFINQEKNTSCWQCALYSKLGTDTYHDSFCQKEDKIRKIQRVIPLNTIYLQWLNSNKFADAVWAVNSGDSSCAVQRAPGDILCLQLNKWKYDSISLESVKYSCEEGMEQRNSQCAGLTGLRNLGNTCYMNAILQCLCSVPPLVEYFLSGQHKAALHKENGESATAFGCLISDMWLGEFDCVSPEVFHSILGKRYPTFSEKTQQDAQEFLICVLNELHEALKKSSKRRCLTKAKASSVSETSIITQLFEGQLSYSITCLQCKATTDRPETFTVLSLPLPSKSRCSLQDCLKCFFQQDTLTWNNQIHCSRCGTKQDATLKATISKAPQIIIFHLKRFKWQGKQERKLSTDIRYPLTSLDLSPYTSPLCRQDAEYSLCAVANHFGFLDDGHYTAFCKHSVTKNWYSFDDAQITKIPNSSVQTDTAYLLFYICQGLLCTH